MLHKIIILVCLLFFSFSGLFAQDNRRSENDTGIIKVDSLKAAVVTAISRPRLRGDTVEYNTTNVRLRVNATVEELLGRLPGLQVDPDGTITYNGQKIQHLLIDGEDVFGSDPTMITRNLDASKIARVQLLDRKSDQAIFTGVDDGARTKTLNLVMKDSEKNAMFGRVDAGANTNGTYNANGIAALFRSKEQLMFLGISANTGVTGFSSGVQGSAPGTTFNNGSSDPLGASAGAGIPRFSAAALHYANTWEAPFNHLWADYQYSHYFTEPNTTTESLQTEPDSIYQQTQFAKSVNLVDQHWLIGMCDWKTGNRSDLKLIFRGNNAAAQNQLYAAGNSSFNDTLVNSSVRQIRDNVSQQNFGLDLLWRLQIGKQLGRVFSIANTIKENNNTTNGFLFSNNQFYQPNGMLQTVDTTDERKVISSHLTTLTTTLSLTQPLWTGTIVGVYGGFASTFDNPLQETFENNNGKYDLLIDSLCSHFNTRMVSDNLGVNIQGKNGHITYTIGGQWIGSHYRQSDLFANSLFQHQYSNWAPKLLFTYTPNSSTNWNFTYSSTVQPPTTSQLAPINNNSDPLHILIGNPGLKSTANHYLLLQFQRFKKWIMNVSVNYTFNSNAIATRTTTDSLGRQTSQPVNVNGNQMGALYVSLNRKILGFETTLRSNGSINRSLNYINTELSSNDAYTAGGGITLDRTIADIFSLHLLTNFVYFYQVSSINRTVPIHYWTQNHQGGLSIFLFRGFEVNTNAIYTWQQKNSSFSGSTSVLLWNSYISRDFLSHRFVVKFQFNNLLNANAGITRSNAGNVNTQSSTNILGRYWMVSAIYHFDRKFKMK